MRVGFTKRRRLPGNGLIVHITEHVIKCSSLPEAICAVPLDHLLVIIFVIALSSIGRLFFVVFVPTLILSGHLFFVVNVPTLVLSGFFFGPLNIFL